MNQLLRQQDTSCLRDRDGGCTEMLSKQPAELSLADAQAFGEPIDTAFIECASVDQRQRPRYGVRRPAPGGKLGRRFRPTAQARAEASFLRRCCRRVERHVFPFRHRCRADRTAIDPSCPDPAEQPTVEARVARTKRAITRVNIEVHDPIVAPGRAECLAVFGHHQRAMKAERYCMEQSSQRRTFATMTARADRLTKRAKTAGSASSVRSSYPASSARVFVDALERLNYSVESLLCDAGICRADLDEPDARIPCELWGAMFRQALALRPMKNVGVRLATVTPFGAFPLI